jgi:hypothetical protein
MKAEAMIIACIVGAAELVAIALFLASVVVWAAVLGGM